MTKGLDDGSFYVEGRTVRRNPIVTKHADGGATIDMGFPVCVLHDAAGNEAADAIAAGLNALFGLSPKDISVPKEPTEKMLEAGCRALEGTEAREAILVAGTHSDRAIARTKMKLRWAAMVSAADQATP